MFSGMDSVVVALIFSIAKREVTFLSGMAAIKRLSVTSVVRINGSPPRTAPRDPLVVYVVPLELDDALPEVAVCCATLTAC